MTGRPKILVFAGSTRSASLNKKLARLAAAAARDAGADVTEIDLRDYPLPLFDADLEKRDGFPVQARRLQDLFAAQDGFLIASPEHNRFISAVLKNTVDWISRNRDGRRGLDALEGRVAGIMSASPGRLGGLRGLSSLRTFLSGIGVMVIPGELTVPRAHEAFDDQGRLLDADKAAAVADLARTVVDYCRRLRTVGSADDGDGGA